MLLLYRPAAGHDDMDAFQGELNVLEQWAERWGMIFNLDKWHVVKFGAQDLSNRIYFINGKAIGCVESFKYLGVTIANDFSWDLHIQQGPWTRPASSAVQNNHYEWAKQGTYTGSDVAQDKQVCAAFFSPGGGQ